MMMDIDEAMETIKREIGMRKMGLSLYDVRVNLVIYLPPLSGQVEPLERITVEVKG